MDNDVTEPKLRPPLDPGFRPVVLANHHFQREATLVGASAVICLEREGGDISQFDLVLFPEGHECFSENFSYVERMVKFLIWQRGGYKIYFGGPASIANHLGRLYSPQGERRFDQAFLGEQVYQQPFQVTACRMNEVPASRETGSLPGRHMEGCRVGFDLGASDRKVCAVVNGKTVFSEEVVWDPRRQTDPEYHFNEILGAIRKAAARMPRLDAVGGSAAGGAARIRSCVMNARRSNGSSSSRA